MLIYAGFFMHCSNPHGEHFTTHVINQHNTWFVNAHSHGNKTSHLHTWNDYNTWLMFQSNSCKIGAWTCKTEHSTFDLVWNFTLLLFQYWISLHQGSWGSFGLWVVWFWKSLFIFKKLNNISGAPLCTHWYKNITVKHLLISLTYNTLLAYINGSVWALYGK